MNLVKQKCKACEGWMKPMIKEECSPLLKQIRGWEVVEDKKIEKKFRFKNFKEALTFVNKVGEIAESENHHPNIFL
ncbi:4a-hydroxytetrahydrobiopterin dehydratase, partial [Candidatus Roizmanbacteria bacterium]|nr:4a-hydroxytetrahydrobiopterin dehydratase [Candidatus Roizmanbacteria bacterium]